MIGLPTAILVAILVAAAIPPAPAGAKRAATCDGKAATIVADAARIVGTRAHDVIVAGPGANAILGMGGNDTICAGSGDDTIYGGRGNDTVFGEEGDDAIYGERGSDRLDGGPGTDRVFGESGNDSLEGGPGGHDHLDAGPGDDTVSGGPGDFDVLHGGAGNDRLDGGPGAHDIASYSGAGGPLAVDLESGSVSGAERESLSGIEDVLGGSGDDLLAGAAASANRLDGGPGDDRLVAVGEGDEAFGGPGDDACSGPFLSETDCGGRGAGGGTVVARVGSIAGPPSLVVTGSGGPDEVVVSFSGDGYLLSGGGTVDVVLGDPGSGACERDRAANSVFCSGAVGSIQAALRGGNDTFTVADSVPAGVASTIDGGSGSDTLRGGAGDDILYGGADQAPDTLEGGGGDDVIFGINIFHPRRDSGAARMLGGPGNDLLVGGQPCGGDLFHGGPGSNDSASFARVRNSGIHVKATIGGPVLDPDVGDCANGWIDASVEKIEGSPGPDVLAGDGGANTLLGRGGDDVLDGRGGFDRCIGGAGGNRLSGCEASSWAAPLRGRVR